VTVGLQPALPSLEAANLPQSTNPIKLHPLHPLQPNPTNRLQPTTVTNQPNPTESRYPTLPIAELSRHQGYVNALSWAPHSSSHICTVGDDAQVRARFVSHWFAMGSGSRAALVPPSTAVHKNPNSSKSKRHIFRPQALIWDLSSVGHPPSWAATGSGAVGATTGSGGGAGGANGGWQAGGSGGAVGAGAAAAGGGAAADVSSGLDPILSYTAGSDINQLQWSVAQPDWIAINFGVTTQVLRV
jgi:hypothetical protein